MWGGAAPRVSGEITHTNTGVEVTVFVSGQTHFCGCSTTLPRVDVSLPVTVFNLHESPGRFAEPMCVLYVSVCPVSH